MQEKIRLGNSLLIQLYDGMLGSFDCDGVLVGTWNEDDQYLYNGHCLA